MRFAVYKTLQRQGERARYVPGSLTSSAKEARELRRELNLRDGHFHYIHIDDGDGHPDELPYGATLWVETGGPL